MIVFTGTCQRKHASLVKGFDEPHCCTIKEVVYLLEPCPIAGVLVAWSAPVNGAADCPWIVGYKVADEMVTILHVLHSSKVELRGLVKSFDEIPSLIPR